MSGEGLDFEIDLNSRMQGAADAVTQLDRFESQLKAAKGELSSLEKSFVDTDKSLEKLASQLADTRIAMQRAMQEGDEKKFWKLAQTTDDLTKREEALRKKSFDLKAAITAQQKVTKAAADEVGHAATAEKKLQTVEEARDKRLKTASALVDRYGGRLGGLVKTTASAAEEASSLTEGLGMVGTVAVGAVAGLALVAVAVLAVGAAFVSAAAAVGKYAIEQANARRDQEQTLRALTQNNEAAKAASAAFQDIGHDTGTSNEQLLAYSRGLTETRRQMGLAQASTKDYQTVLRAAATAATALGDQSAGQAIIDKFNAGLMTADQLADRVDKKYGDVVKEKMLGLDQQTTTLERNLSGLTEHFNVKPFLEGLQRMIDLTDKNTASGKFLQDIFDHVFGAASGSMVERFFVGLERMTLKTEIVITDAEIYFYKFKNALTSALNVDLGPFGTLRDRLGELGGAFEKIVPHALAFLNPYTTIAEVSSDIGAGFTSAAHALTDLEGELQPAKMEALATDFIDGFIAGLDKGIHRVEDKVKSIGGAAIKAMRSVLDSHSPSRVFADIGMTIPEGLEQGVDEGAPSVAQSVGALIEPHEFQPAAPANQGASTGTSTGGGGPVFHIVIQGVNGAEDMIDKLEERLVAIFERRALQMGTDAEAKS